MSRGTTRRTVRIEDALWEKAQEKAAVLGDNLSDIIRDKLRDYIESENAHMLAEAWEEGKEAGMLDYHNSTNPYRK